MKVRVPVAGKPGRYEYIDVPGGVARPLAHRQGRFAVGQCIHRGEPTGETRDCKTCGGSQSIPLLACNVHGQCTTDKTLPGVAWCRTCPDKQATASRRQQVLHRCNHGLGDNVQCGIVLRHLRHYHPDDEQHVVAERGKHSIFHKVAHHVHMGNPPGPDAAWGMIHNHPWHNPHLCYQDSPSTKAAHTLRETLGLPVIPDLLRYEIHVGDEARRRAEQWRAERLPPCPFVLIHYEGSSWTGHKNLPVEALRPLVDMLLARGITPVVLDFGSNALLSGKRGVFALRPQESIWQGWGQGDAEHMAALMGLSALNVMIDSGPGKVAASVAHVPCLTIWRELHPLHFSDLDYGQVTHLIPDNHADHMHGNAGSKEAGLRYFRQHYRHEIYAYDKLTSRIVELAGRLLDESVDPVCVLASKSNRFATMWPFLQLLKPGSLVAETGCMRQLNDHGAGMSTLAFGLHLQRLGGRLVSLDNNQANVALAQSQTSGLPVDVRLADSRGALRNWSEGAIGALYLDSADTGTPGFEECCLEEAQLALPHLAPDALILIDDTEQTGANQWSGKGALAIPWLLAQGWRVEAQRRQTLLSRNHKGRFIPGTAGLYHLRTGKSCTVVTAFTSDYLPSHAERFAQTKADYCRRHSYAFRLHRTGFDASRPPAWSKILFVLEALEHAEWVCWMDADAEIRNPDVYLESLITSDADMIVSEDANGLNSGVFLIRSCAWARDFLNRVWERTEFIDDCWWEQRAMHAILAESETDRSHVRIVPQSVMNSSLDGYVEGDFVVHYAGGMKEALA